MVGSVIEKVMSLFKTSTTKDYYKPFSGGKEPRKTKINQKKKKSEKSIIKDKPF